MWVNFFEIDEESLRQLKVAEHLGLDEEKWVSDKLESWENEKRNVPSGLYQEPDEPKVIHQQKFVEAIRNVSPRIIEELRPFAPNFNALFGEIASNDEFLEKLKIIFALQEPPYEALDGFRFTHSTATIWQNFSWKRYKVPLLWSKYLFDLEKTDDKNSVSIPNVVKIWLDELYESKDIWTEQAEDFAKKIKEVIITAFQETAPDKDLIWENFLTLQCGIYTWMERYHFDRDFLFENAYAFLFQFSQDENLPTKDLKLWGRTHPRRLQSYEFKFQSEGWWAKNEKAEEFKKRVTKEFKSVLDNYIYASSNYLHLANKLHATRPKDPDYTSIYWLIAWNEGATFPQIAECFNATIDTIKDGLNALKLFDLPKRQDKPGRKGKYLSVSEERIQEIRKIFLEFKRNRKEQKK